MAATLERPRIKVSAAQQSLLREMGTNGVVRVGDDGKCYITGASGKLRRNSRKVNKGPVNSAFEAGFLQKAGVMEDAKLFTITAKGKVARKQRSNK